MLDNIRKELISKSDQLESVFWESAMFLHDNPEISTQEFKACRHLSDVLGKYGFQVEKGVAGMETAFIGKKQLGESIRPTIAFMAEYDALPELGHACGHNLIGAAAIGAAITLASINSLEGQVVVLGTPAEETVGGKIPFVKQGFFNSIDAALMAHPGEKTLIKEKNRACIFVEVEFKGRPSHAAGKPFKGLNALDAVVSLFTNVGLLRQQLPDDVRIHGIITHGGVATNVIPEYTRAEFLVRSTTIKDTLDTLEKFKNCIKASAMATGTTETIKVDMENMFEPIKSNSTLISLFKKHTKHLGGVVHEWNPEQIGGSSDIGNVSQVVPAIHPHFGIVAEEKSLISHTQEFAEAAKSDQARKALSNVIKSLAMCGADLMTDPEILNAVKSEFIASG
ncbi:MAG: M20 family metallopeptidase [Proteobacteria bacterium]|nr:M20 family metallopeptidase [Pseudomonadota bacterium]